MFILELEARVNEVDEQWIIDVINDKIASDEFSAGIKPYGEVKKSICIEEVKRYGKYYLWDNYIDHLMAADVSLGHLATIAGLDSTDGIACNAA